MTETKLTNQQILRQREKYKEGTLAKLVDVMGDSNKIHQFGEYIKNEIYVVSTKVKGIFNDEYDIMYDIRFEPKLSEFEKEMVKKSKFNPNRTVRVLHVGYIKTIKK